MSAHAPYTEAEKAALVRLWPRAVASQLAEALPGRTWNSMQHQAKVLKVRRTYRGDGTNKLTWSKEHQDLLRKYYPTHGRQYVADLVGRKPGAVASQAWQMGVPFNPAKARVAAANPPKPAPKPVVVAPKPVVVLEIAVKTNPNTPLLNKSKAARRRAEKGGKGESISDQVRRLPADSVARRVFLLAGRNGGPAATAAFLEWKSQQAA
jgi:hypothetical protein